MGAQTSVQSLITMMAAAILVGCSASSNAGQECTDIGAATGIGVDLDPAVATHLDSRVELAAQWQDQHMSTAIQLSPATAPQDQDCTGESPSDECSAETKPTGGMHGFADIADLPDSPVEISVRIDRSDGSQEIDQTVTATPQSTHPNGPTCPSQGRQIQLTVDADGVLQSDTGES